MSKSNTVLTFSINLFILASQTNSFLLLFLLAYHAIGMDLNRIFMIDKKSRIVNFEGTSSFERYGSDGDVGSDDDGVFTFPPQQWYKGRMGAKFDGYTDPKLLSQLGADANIDWTSHE
jgi:hypothetical protein